MIKILFDIRYMTYPGAACLKGRAASRLASAAERRMEINRGCGLAVTNEEKNLATAGGMNSLAIEMVHL